jgi:hypothetical protein
VGVQIRSSGEGESPPESQMLSEPVIDKVPDMCLNGVVSSDLIPLSTALEIKKRQAPINYNKLSLEIKGILYNVENIINIVNI